MSKVLQFAGRPTNEKCKACAKLIITAGDVRREFHLNGYRFEGKQIKPNCYRAKRCSQIRGYYRDHELTKARIKDYKRAIKGLLDGCNLCGNTEVLEAHHIIPIAIGGHETQENRLTLCKQCHQTISRYYTMIGLMNVTVEHEKRAKRI